MPTRYKKLKLPDGSTIDEHRFVWEQHYGSIPKGWVVHHKNENTRDNRIENLEIMSRSAHTSMHLYKSPTSVKDGICTHGTNTGYTYYACRCALCRQAHAYAVADYRIRTGKR